MEETGAPSPISSRRHPVALLALLTPAPSRTLSRGKLVGYLWPETREKTGRNRLGSCVHQVRSSLGEEVLTSHGDDLRLEADVVDCDVWRFRAAVEAEAFEAAVEHYGGPFLDGFRLPDAPAFEKWMERQRTELRADHRRSLERLAEAAEDRGEPERAAAWWRRRANEDPYDSRIIRRLMEALAAAGNRPAALRAARVHARLVEEELGTAADPGIEELAGRLRRGETTGAGEIDAREEPSAERADRAPGGSPDGPTGTPGTEEPAVGKGSGAASDGAPTDAGPRRPAGPPDGSAGRAPEGNGGPTRGWRPIALAAALLLLGGVGMWSLLTSGGGQPPPLGDRSIAILPFEPLGEQTSRAVADGLHADLMTRLSNVSGVAVISGTSVQRYRETDLSLARIARELGVKWVLEGGVQEAAGEIQVNAQLIDAGTDTHAWAETYRRDLTAENLFDLQAEVARRIVRALEAEIGRSELRLVEERPTRDLEAFRLYVQGQSHLRRRTEAGMSRAAELFGQAIARDSGYARAWVGLARSRVHLRWYGYGPQEGAVEAALAAVERAVELAPEQPMVQAALGEIYMLQHRGPEALRALERGESLGWRGWMYVTLGQVEQGLPLLERSARLAPNGPAPQASLASGYLFAGRPLELVLEHARRARELSSGYAWAHLIEGQALALEGRPGPAIAALERGLEQASREARPRHRAWLSVALARAGDTARAREQLARIEATGHPYAAGVAHAGLGQVDEAFAAFRRANWNSMQTPNLRYHPALAPLRDDPRYPALIEEVNRRWGLRPDGSLPEERS